LVLNRIPQMPIYLRGYFPYRLFVKPLFWPFVKTPKNGAQTTLYVALDPELDKVTGQYFSDCKLKEMAPAATDSQTAKWLWAVSEKWTTPTMIKIH